MAKVNRVYCCSNYLRTEAFILSITELVLSIIALVMTLVFDYLWNFEISWLNKLAVDDYDLRSFLKMPIETQEIILLSTLVVHCIDFFSSCLLFMGVKHKNGVILKFWFLLGCLKFVYSSVTLLMFLYKTQSKLLYAASGLLYIMYSLYVLHIIKLFMKELATVGQASQLDPQMYPEIDDSRTDSHLERY